MRGVSSRFFTQFLFFIMGLAAAPAVPASAQALPGNNIRGEGADYHYEGVLTIAPETGHVATSWQLEILNPQQAEIGYLLRNTLKNIQVGGPDLEAYSVEQKEGWDGFHFIKIKLKNPENAAPRKITMAYDGVLFPAPPEEDYNAVTPERIDLHLEGFWYPMDAGFNKNLTAELTIDAGAGWTPVSTDDLRYEGAHLKLTKTHPFLDISFTLLKGAAIHKGQNYTIYDLRSEGGNMPMMIEVADYCVAFLNRNFGAERPLPHSNIMINKREKGGFARRSYISLANVDNYDRQRLTTFVCHELSHYWSSEASVGSADSWLNEGFATFVESMALRDVLGQAAFDARIAKYEKQIADWMAKNDGSGRPTSVWSAANQSRRPHILSYRKAFLHLVKLETYLGEDAFLKFLQARFNQPVRTTEQLLKILEDVTDRETSGWFLKLLES